MIELAIVLIIAGVLASIALPGFTTAQRRRNTQNARDTFVWLASRARARAIETGTTQLLEIDPATERAWVVKRNATVASDTVQTVNYATEFRAGVSTSTAAKVTVCYNPRGYAWSCAPGSPSADVQVTFAHNGLSAGVRVRRLGQVERM